MEGTGSPAFDRLVDATNAHDVDAMMECFDPDYRSEQPLHPRQASAVANRWAGTGA